jgi:peptidoglycan hydrolase-like protein with peptidoglycan-binding domain
VGAAPRGRALATATVGLAILAAGCSGSSAPQGTAGSTAVGAADHIVPLRLRTITPTHKLYAHTRVVVTFSTALSAKTLTPTLTPRLPGRWTVSGSSATFTPVRDYAPSTTYKVTLPGGRSGMTNSSGGHLRKTHHVALVSPTPSVSFAEQILARLHYLPLTTTADRPRTPAAAAAAVYHPPTGHFRWRWHSTPAALHGLWDADKPNSLLQGALLAFQHQAGLTPDELLGPTTWKALTAADAAHAHDPDPYSYIYANLSSRPQTLTVWRAGRTVLSSPVNGGVPGALTPDGTFPIYERLSSTTMSGTNPDGSHYSDPGVPWVNYFSGGSAVHGFPRASYGTPQSVGCLELPIPTARTVFGLVSYGTLVTVTG